MQAILIATGDEITQGDILNTTGPAIARQLAERNINIVKHILVPDKEDLIQAAIEEALNQADYIFTTGGLGPTSDDLTRYALAKALKKELVFDQDSWDAIVKRLSAYKLHVHEDNRRQAYFPEGAEIFDNPYGTAAGCKVKFKDKSLYMLPGPPHECLPMFEQHVLSKLPSSKPYKLHWLLLGASEGEIAADLDKCLKTIARQTGYRAEYPYLEIKVWTENAANLQEAEKLIEPLLSKYLVSKHNQFASKQLQGKISREKIFYTIFDTATGGMLENSLVTPETREFLSFVRRAEEADIILCGLNEFWQSMPTPIQSEIVLSIAEKTISRKLYYRNASVKNFATEWTCWQLLEILP